MTNYCTFFDQGYLSQGLALWYSIRRHHPDSALWVLAMDAETASLLRRLSDGGLHIVDLDYLLLADRQLAAVRDERSRAEFAFTVKSCFCRYLLREYASIETLIYLDADLYLFGRPELGGHHFGEHSLLLVPHRYPLWQDDSNRYGRFNAGVIGFRNNEIAHGCLNAWRAQCIESCGVDGDGRRYGDQKYLDEWPSRYGNSVRIEGHPGVNLAPWNWVSYSYRITKSEVLVEGVPLLLFHFAQFRWVSSSWVDSGQLEYGVMPLSIRSTIYGEYIAALLEAESSIRVMRPDYSIPTSGWKRSLGSFRMAVLRIICGQFWLRSGPYLLAGRFGLGRFSGRGMAIYRRWQRRAR